MTTRTQLLAIALVAGALAPAAQGAMLGAQSPDASIRVSSRPSRATRSDSTTTADSASRKDSSSKAKPDQQAPRSPLAIHVGDADLLIGGFMDAMAVYRSENTGSGLGSNFGAVPFNNPNVATGNLAETRFSAQNSRLTLAATSKHGDDNLKGYVEADFLGQGPTSLNVTSNANTLRMRLYWVQYSTSSWEVLAGQSWSLLTPNRNGVSPVPGDIFYSQDIDTNYQMGLTWGRTPGFRFTLKPADGVTAAVALENPQQYVGGAVTLPGTFTAAEVDQGANTAAANPLPDVIGKLALDPKIGDLHQHFEVAGVYRSFKTYQVPVAATATTNAIAAQTFTSSGTGVSVDAVLEPMKQVHLIGTAFFSSGGGRYIANTSLPDFIINGDGSISTVSASSYIGGAEIQAMPNTLIYGYYSYAKSTKDSTSDQSIPAKPIGYGLVSTTPNNTLSELSVGITQTFFRNANIGGMQGMIQYSLVKRTPFTVPTTNPVTSSNASMNMVYVDVRYILP